MKVAYLASTVTLADAPNRRSDASEHDQMMDCLRSSFETRSASVLELASDDQNADWKAFDAVIIGTAWDYQDRHEEFLAALENISSVTNLFNSPAMVKWNSRKTYLRDLGDKGVTLIPTLWIDRPSEDAVAAAFDRFATDQIVLKRQVGASAEGQHRLRRHDPVPQMTEPMMVQPFLDSITSVGEYSFIFIDGALCHAVVKKPAMGDYRIQAAYGGTEAAISVSPGDAAVAAKVLSAIDETPLYARVDMLRGKDGNLQLMELELVEPFLYPLQGPDLGERIYEAVKQRI